MTTIQEALHSAESNDREGRDRILIPLQLTLVSVLSLGYLGHFAFRQIKVLFHVYDLREILMTGTGILVLVALYASSHWASKTETTIDWRTIAVGRIPSALLAIAFAVCAIAAFSSGATIPRLPAVNLGWMVGGAAVVLLLHSVRSPGSAIRSPLLGAGGLVVGFAAADGFHQGLITAGTVAWNVVTDFDLAVLLPLTVLYFLIESILFGEIDPDPDKEEILSVTRQIFGATAVYVLVLGIAFESALIACISVGLVLAAFLVVATEARPRRRHPKSGWDRLLRRGMTWCAVLGVMAVVLRGIGHLGEAAAIAAFCLAFVGLSIRWLSLRSLSSVLVSAAQAMLVVGLAFMVAALWNLFANHHTGLAALRESLDIPDAAIFVGGVVVLLGLTYRFNPLAGVVLVAPVLFLGLERFWLDPVWTVPVIAVVTGATSFVRHRSARGRVAGAAACGLIVIAAIAANFSEPLLGEDHVTWTSAPPRSGDAPESWALADGRVRSADQLEANLWIDLRTHGPAPLRPAHGGSAFDSKRRQILMFGADTHFRDWNNAVTSFDVASQTWTRHYRPSPRYALRSDVAGNRIAGIIREAPWPMHVYDGVVYHPGIDALVVVGSPLHSLKVVANGRFDPTWIYDLKSRRWRKGPITGGAVPRFFGGTAVYDERRGSVFYFNTVGAEFAQLPIGTEGRYFVPELFELSGDLREWRKVSDALPRPRPTAAQIHRLPDGKPGLNAEISARRDEILVFEGDALGSRVRGFSHLGPRQSRGTWRTRAFRDDECVVGVPYAVTQGSDDRFLLLPAPDVGVGNRTCVYDVERDVVASVASATLPHLSMNFNLHYDPASKLFILVRGKSLHLGRASVHVLRLDPSKL